MIRLILILLTVFSFSTSAQTQDTGAATRWIVSTWKSVGTQVSVEDFDAYTSPLRQFMRDYDAALVACQMDAESTVDTGASTRTIAFAYVTLGKAISSPVGSALLRNHGRAIKLYIRTYDAAILDACLETPAPREAQFMLTPTTIEKVGRTVSEGYVDLDPRTPVISSLWGADRWSSTSKNRQPAEGFMPGMVVVLSPGEYEKFRITKTFDVDPSKLGPEHLNPDGSIKYGLKNNNSIPKEAVVFGFDPMTYLVAEVPGATFINGNLTVGGTKTQYLEWGGAITYEGMVFRGDDTACFMTENMKQEHEWQEKRDVCLIDCKIDGGWDASKPGKALRYGKVKWGMLTYGLGISALGADVAGFQWISTGVNDWDAEGIWGEHIAYHHNIRALTPEHTAVLLDGIRARWAGRTFLQVVNRVGEISDAVKIPPGFTDKGQGRIVVRDCYVEDVCLQDGGGGSAFTFAGNHDGHVMIEDTTVMLGCNPDLATERHDNITGAFVCYAGGGSEGRPTKAITIRGCHFEVGKVFKGKGSARRGNLQISDVGTFELLDTEVWNWAGTREALDIELSSIGLLVLDTKNDVHGDCLVEGFAPFRDTDADSDGFPDGVAYPAMLDALRGQPGVEIR